MFTHTYHDITTVENVLQTWERFRRGKRHARDVALFEARLGEHLVELYRDLSERTYLHGPYSAFVVVDPKPRSIHKASVRDRVLHRLLYDVLYGYFDARFIHDSYSCRNSKGTHRALARFNDCARTVSKNNTRTCYVLKCDIKKFFTNIDQSVLTNILQRHIADDGIRWLIDKVLSSFSAGRPGIGLPLGNLTSQLFANVYLHEFDRYVKQELRVKHYVRYADDIVVLADNREHLISLLPKLQMFLQANLHLQFHEDKVRIATWASGIDFLGWVHFPYHRQLHTVTKRRIVSRMRWYPRPETVLSYRGLLRHGNTYDLQRRLNFL